MLVEEISNVQELRANALRMLRSECDEARLCCMELGCMPVWLKNT